MQYHNQRPPFNWGPLIALVVFAMFFAYICVKYPMHIEKHESRLIIGDKEV